MTLWQERGGVPLLTVVALLLCVCLGAAITVGTYREETPGVTTSPPTTRPQRSIRLEDLAAELATALADELELTPAEERRIAEIVTDAGEAAVVVGPPQPPEPPAPSTTVTTTTTTMPPPPTRPPVLGVVPLEDVLDDYVPPTTAP